MNELFVNIHVSSSTFDNIYIDTHTHTRRVSFTVCLAVSPHVLNTHWCVWLVLICTQRNVDVNH